jgi:hypothetical protein
MEPIRLDIEPAWLGSGRLNSSRLDKIASCLNLARYCNELEVGLGFGSFVMKFLIFSFLLQIALLAVQHPHLAGRKPGAAEP